MSYQGTLEERFWKRVDRQGPTDCWPWKGNRIRYGYGLMGSGTPRKRRVAHRIAYEICIGPIPESKIVCHRCDHPWCVNPAHLFLGTHADNMRDKVAKGRQARGESNGAAKLSVSEVQSIRCEYEYGVCGAHRLARKYGVSKRMIQLILSGRKWQWLPYIVQTAPEEPICAVTGAVCDRRKDTEKGAVAS